MAVASTDPSLSAEIPERLNIAEHFLDAPAARHPARTAIVAEPARVTYAELAALACRVGNALLEQGVAPGDRVLIVLPDSAEFVASFFGSAKIGAVAVRRQRLRQKEGKEVSLIVRNSCQRYSTRAI